MCIRYVFNNNDRKYRIAIKYRNNVLWILSLATLSEKLKLVQKYFGKMLKKHILKSKIKLKENKNARGALWLRGRNPNPMNLIWLIPAEGSVIIKVL